jgi:hypothetical protein
MNIAKKYQEMKFTNLVAGYCMPELLSMYLQSHMNGMYFPSSCGHLHPKYVNVFDYSNIVLAVTILLLTRTCPLDNITSDLAEIFSFQTVPSAVLFGPKIEIPILRCHAFNLSHVNSRYFSYG